MSSNLILGAISFSRKFFPEHNIYRHMPFAQTGNIQTYYEVNGQGPPLVFIHGAGASHDMWSPQVDYFSDRFTVITYDIRGHQQTEGSDEKYTCELYADDLYALIQQLETPNPVLCGLSLGGMIAQEYAIKYPEQLRGLILADTAVSSALTLSDKITKALYPARLVKWTVNRMSKERYAEWSFKFYEMNEEVREYLIQQQLLIEKEELVKLIDAIYSFTLLPLETIEVPTLILLGENEKKAVFTHAERMLELLPYARKVVIPDAGHVSNLENVEFFNREVEQFLQVHDFASTEGL
ncbi:MAG: alpha/beta fold hydrolase [Candidatus Lokiarchaeota archaeon]|nr:alpha/beta fold hydrolase [Candidatus Lokiarchaeota archaeon]